MSETPSSRPSSPAPSKTTTNALKLEKFSGDGQAFKGKLIGMEDLSIDRDEKVCLDSMFKLKAVVKARGEHKQRIQINLTMNAVKIIDETTKAQVASHEIERISFVVIDPRDNRAFGYIYNTSDDRHQFWAIKTERAAAVTVLALKELFELAFEIAFGSNSNSTSSKEDGNKSTPTSAQPTVQTPEPQPAVAPVTTPAPVQPPPATDPAPTVTDLLGDLVWDTPVPAPTPVVTQPVQAPPSTNLFGTEPPASVAQPPPPVAVAPATTEVDPLAEIFSSLSTTVPPTQPVVAPPTSTTPLFDAFSNPAQPPATNQYYGSTFTQPTQSTQPNYLNINANYPTQQAQRPLTPTSPGFQQPDSTSPISPIAPPTVTSPFAGLDILGSFSSNPTAKTTKESFFTSTPPPKTVQQLLMEKQP